eukprot:2738177-Rhodomonas_salina.2
MQGGPSSSLLPPLPLSRASPRLISSAVFQAQPKLVPAFFFSPHANLIAMFSAELLGRPIPPYVQRL